MRPVRGTSRGHSASAVVKVELPPPLVAAPGLDAIFRAFYELHHDSALDFACRLTSKLDAEDAVHEVMTDLWLKWVKSGPEDIPRQVLHAMIRNKVRRQHRLAKRLVSIEDAESELEAQVFRASLAPLRGDTPGDVMDLAVAALPPTRREVFLLVCEHDFTYKEVGAALRVSEGTINTHMYLAKRQVRAMFAARRALPRTGDPET